MELGWMGKVGMMREGDNIYFMLLMSRIGWRSCLGKE